MAEVVVYGIPQSTFVRTARMALVEKGVDYVLNPLQPQSPEMLAVNPFGKVPGFRHGELVLFETLAITRYIDETFPGPALQPGDTAGRTRMTQWASAISDSLYASAIVGCVIERLAKPMWGQKTDEARIKAALPTIERHLAIFDDALAQSPFLAGAKLSLADLFLAPIFAYLIATPDTHPLLPRFGRLGDWFKRVATRPSFTATGAP